MTPKQISSLRTYEPWLELALEAHPSDVYAFVRILCTNYEHREGTLWDHPGLHSPCKMCGKHANWFYNKQDHSIQGCLLCHIRWFYRQKGWQDGPEPATTRCCEVCRGLGHDWRVWGIDMIPCKHCQGKGMIEVK